MNRTLVNIISHNDPLPAYLFIKENYQDGDRLLFVSARRDGEKIDFLTNLIKIDPNLIDDIVLKYNSDEYTYERICRRLKAQLHSDTTYLVNLAGGSRYMALAVHQVFESFNTKFFYTQTRENIIVSSIFDNSIYDNDDIFYPIRYRMTLAEYFQVHGLSHDIDRKHFHKPIIKAQQTQNLFNIFTKKQLSSEEYETINTLRTEYRGMSRAARISDIEHKDAPRLSSLLRHIGFTPSNEGYISPDEVEYLTGGWFEEYVYNLIERTVKPQDIAIGVHIARPGEKHNNELDVCFIKANTLFVIECKTGVQSDHMFNEIVYKACALREALLGMTCHSYIFSLKYDNEGDLERVARIMDITFCSQKTLTTPYNINAVTQNMIQLSHETVDKEYGNTQQ